MATRRATTLAVANDWIETPCQAMTVFGVEVSGTWAGTITFQTEIGGTWADALTYSLAQAAVVSTTTVNVKRLIDTMGCGKVRAVMTAFTSGAAVVAFNGTVGNLLVGGGGGGGAGTQYTEGDIDASITGTALMWEDTGDTLRAVSAALPLPVTVISGGGAGTQYTEGDVDATITGTALMWEDTGNTLRAVSAALPLPVNTELPTAAVLSETLFLDPVTTTYQAAMNCLYDPVVALGWVRQRTVSALADGNAGGTFSGMMPFVQNAAGTFERTRTAVGGQDLASGTGVLGAAPMVKAVAHGANPTAFTAGRFGAALANVAGIPWSIGGHPNLITRVDEYTSAQTDTAIVTVAGGSLIVVVSQTLACGKANTLNTTARVGFGATNTPALNSAGLVIAHPGIDPGGGVREGTGSAVIGIGTDNQDLRITCTDPGGSLYVTTRYFTISS